MIRRRSALSGTVVPPATAGSVVAARTPVARHAAAAPNEATPAARKRRRFTPKSARPTAPGRPGSSSPRRSSRCRSRSRCSSGHWAHRAWSSIARDRHVPGPLADRDGRCDLITRGIDDHYIGVAAIADVNVPAVGMHGQSVRAQARLDRAHDLVFARVEHEHGVGALARNVRLGAVGRERDAARPRAQRTVAVTSLRQPGDDRSLPACRPLPH